MDMPLLYFDPHIEVLNALQKQAPRRLKSELAALKRYMNTQMMVLGHPVPLQRKISKEGYSFCPDFTESSLNSWNEIWHSTTHFEIRGQALLWLERFKKDPILFEAWPVIQHWANTLDNWAHSDSLSDYYSRLLEAKPSHILPILKKWNKSENPWQRRQSIVSLFYYSSQRKKYPKINDVLRLIENLLDDPEYYVQKGVGWTLREAGNVYPNETWDFLKANIKEIKAVAFTAATEKLSPSKKLSLKKLRV